MKIKQATITELEILTPLFDAYRGFYSQPSDIKGARAFLKERLEKKDSVIFMAFNDLNKPAGFVQLYPSFSSVSMQHLYILNDIFVAPEDRNIGAGSKLLYHAQEFAKKVGAKGLTLETATNNPAQFLYEKYGWKRDTEVYHYTWVTPTQTSES